MAASVSGGKTVNNAIAPHISAATMTTLMGTAPENMTLKQFYQIEDALRRLPNGTERTSSTTLATMFS